VNKYRVVISAVLLSLMFGVTMHPATRQTSSPQDGVIRINVNLVQVDAVVTDGKGKPVTDLSADDFEVLQDGKPQEITNFAYINVLDRSVKLTPRAPTPRQPKNAPPLPPPPTVNIRPEQIRRTIAIVVDDLAMSFNSTVQLREALKQWIDRDMQPGDLVAVIRTSAGMGSLQQFTADKRVLSAAIDLVQYHLGRVGVSSFGPLAGAGLADGVIDTSGFDDEVQHAYTLGSLGAIQYVLQGLRELPGRKTLILFSESMRLQFLQASQGVATQSLNQQTDEERLRRLADAANRSSVVISAVDPRGVVNTGLSVEDNTKEMTPDQINQGVTQRNLDYIASQDGMVMLSQKTGGLFIPGNNDLAAALQEVADDGGGYYLLGYHPEETTFDKKASQRFHSVNVRIKRPGLHIRSRTGFFGTADDQPPAVPETRQAQMVKAMASPFSSGAVRVKLTTLFSDSEKQGSYLNTMLHIDLHDLTFTQDPEGNRTATIDVLAGTFNVDGERVDGLDRSWQLRLPENTYNELLKTGLVYSAHLPVKKPGPYQMRVVLRDATSQNLGSATQFIEVPDLKKGRLALSGIVLAEEHLRKPASGDPAEGQITADDPEGTAALRVFKSGAAALYLYEVLNAHDRDKKPQLEEQVRLFRDGQQVFTTKPTPVNSDKQPNPKRLVGSGRIQLTKVPPGNYILQVIILDKLRKGADSVAAQAIDFQVK
jgi:VWFA-related protein